MMMRFGLRSNWSYTKRMSESEGRLEKEKVRGRFDLAVTLFLASR
jgi:hypothetical protein